MLKLNLYISILISIALCSGCSVLKKNSDRNSINQDEYVQLVNNARNFALLQQAKSLKEEDKKTIKETEPIFSVYYTSIKHGQFFLTWHLSERKVLNVVGSGYLNEKESLRSTNIAINSNE